MTSMASRLGRAILAVPFLLVAAWCFQAMDLEKIDANAQPYAKSGVIQWDDNEISILDNFHGVPILDEIWRGSMATFSTSTFGYDSVGAWQVFSFLIDLGPVFAIWILESSRGANAWSPAYIPTFFTVAAQLLGIGTVAPVFYFLCITFGPTASELAKTPRQHRTVWHTRHSLLVPIVLLLHTSMVLGMFLAPTFASRHYWTWAWQLVPLWIGLGNIVASQAIHLLGVKRVLSPKPTLFALGLISFGVWGYALLFSPHPMSTLFFPEAGPQSGLVLHTRKALQADEVGLYMATFLWLAYSFFDLYISGLVENASLFFVAMLPIVTAGIGPGAAFVLGWYVRERVFDSPKE